MTPSADRNRTTTLLRTAPVLLTEGAVIERVRREHPGVLHPTLANALMLLHPAEAGILRSIYREYLAAAADAGLPILLLTPTWKASGARLRAAGAAVRPTIRAATDLLRAVIAEGGTPKPPAVLVGGLLGPAGDAYRPEEALAEAEAAAYHREQAEELALSGVDFLLASTLPVVGEARGLARAMGATGLPYLVSFLLSPAGDLPDGIPLAVAIASLDSLDPRPLAYLVNCVHPSVLHAIAGRLPATIRKRLVGLQANTSRRPPELREGLAELDTEPPAEFSQNMVPLRETLGFQIFGGCCGTATEHIREMALQLAADGSNRTTGATPG